MEKSEAYVRAERKVKARMGFYTHLGIYAVVNALFFLGSWKDTGTYGFAWFTWPLWIWGGCVILHFLSVFVFKGDMTKRMIEREMEREARAGK
jgi:hypothetical protein